MSDESAPKPKRLRNAKEIEAAYKAGFADGYEARDTDARILKEQEARREGVIRRAIAKANADTMLEIEGEQRSLADWLTWRRE